MTRTGVDSPSPVYRFGPFTFTPGVDLCREGVPVPLQRQPALVLAYLLARPDQLVTREELVQVVWSDGRHVEYNQNLNYCIRQIRAALGDDAGSPRYLRTLPRLGFRWIAPVDGPNALGRGATGWLWRMARKSYSIPGWGMFAAVAVWGVLIAGEVARPPSSTPVPVVGNVPSARGPSEPSHLSMAIDALHTLSHALLEPARRAEAPAALQILWTLTIGLHGHLDPSW